MAFSQQEQMSEVRVARGLRNAEDAMKAKDPMLTDELIAEFKEAFTLFDKDNDGTITTEDLGTVMRSMGQNPTDDDINSLVEDFDVGRTSAEASVGNIEFCEFVLLMSERIKRCNTPGELHDAFKIFDKDGDGTIAVQELRRVMTTLGEKLSEEEVEEMIRVADTKGNGEINYNDFVKVITSEPATSSS